MQKYSGTPGSPGIALGPAFLFHVQELKVIERLIEDTRKETARLDAALATARSEIETLQAQAKAKVGEDEAAIFQAHTLLLEDPELLKRVREEIQNQKINCEFAWNMAIEEYAQMLEGLEGELFQARAADLRDVGQRVLRHLLQIDEIDLSALDEPSIIVAKDLTPSDTIRLDRELVIGFCTAEGGPTSHTAILAKALGLPAVVGLGRGILKCELGATLMIDGYQGEVILDPDRATIAGTKVRMSKLQSQADVDQARASEPAITADGHQVEIVANIGSVEEAERALELGAEGVGLLRTEFLYLNKTAAPDEEEQFNAYQSILNHMGDRPVVARTLDVGGDKPLPYLDLGKEANPFLGWRAIRMCLDQPEFFKVQLRALLRSSPGHDLRIMFPMIATLEEVNASQAILEETRSDLIASGFSVAEEIQIGIMVEVPSVVLMADQFAKKVDFFSIGTNDLTQYTMAAERTNEKLVHLGDALHPAILRQIRTVIQAAHAEGKWVGLCGELGGDLDAAPVLLGLDLDEFSMAPSMIPKVKARMRTLSKAKWEEWVPEVLGMETAAQVREFVRQRVA
jgi:phosphoenolpyruvate-protein phosphotransferase